MKSPLAKNILKCYNQLMDRKIITTNRKAFHDFTILEKFVAGIVLTGTEIKSIRKNAINLKDSFWIMKFFYTNVTFLLMNREIDLTTMQNVQENS